MTGTAVIIIVNHNYDDPGINDPSNCYNINNKNNMNLSTIGSCWKNYKIMSLKYSKKTLQKIIFFLIRKRKS